MGKKCIYMFLMSDTHINTDAHTRHMYTKQRESRSLNRVFEMLHFLYFHPFFVAIGA